MPMYVSLQLWSARAVLGRHFSSARYQKIEEEEAWCLLFFASYPLTGSTPGSACARQAERFVQRVKRVEVFRKKSL